MENKIIQYALLKTLYDKNLNLLECFYPFFVKSLKHEPCLNAIECQEKITSKFDLNIPIHVLQKLTRLGSEKEHIDINDEREIWPIRLTEIGIEFQNQFEDHFTTERRIGELVAGFQDYLANKGIEKDPDSTRADIDLYIRKNTASLSDFIFSHENMPFEPFENHEKEFTEYILKIERSKPTEYVILKEMFYGSIIASSLLLPQKEFEGVINSKFKSTKVYFDANFLFSLLGYHDTEFSIPANELHGMLKKFGFQLM